MKLNYKVYGHGPPVIILHGLFGMLDNWRTVAKKLEDKYQCFLVDLRNHGRSPHDEEMNYEVMAEDVYELINDLNLDSFILAGHSMGGKVAMQFVMAHPEKVSKLIVIDISPSEYPHHHEAVIEAIQSIDPLTLEKRSDAERNFQLYLGGDEATIQFLLKNLDRLPSGGFKWKANMPVLIKKYDELMQSITPGSTFGKPSLFIRGELSNSLKDEDWPEIQKLFPQAQLVTVKKAGHWVHADQPGALIHTMSAFMEPN